MSRDARRSKWYDHKRNATKRGISFNFTFEEWVTWWVENLGVDWVTKRGRSKNQYCMARINDKGAYERGNVQCVTNAQNHDEQWTEEARLKKGEQQKNMTLEHREKLRVAALGNDKALGYKHSEEARAAMSRARKGRSHVGTFTGRRHSFETIQQMSEARRLWWEKRREQDACL